MAGVLHPACGSAGAPMANVPSRRKAVPIGDLEEDLAGFFIFVGKKRSILYGMSQNGPVGNASEREFV